MVAMRDQAHEEGVKTIDGLVQKWEELLEEQDTLEQEDKWAEQEGYVAFPDSIKRN